MTGEGDGPTAPSPVQASLRGLCPRCGAPGLFGGLLRFAPRCRNCHLDFGSFNVGDGPAALVTLGFGTLVTIGVLWVELAFSPPWWVHLILWLPITLVGVIGSLRITKAALAYFEYRNSAHQAGDRR